jgi:flagellar hook-associated protein FlgK
LVDAVSSSLAGLNAASTRLATASNRIANASTPPKPDEVTGITPSSNGISIDEEIVNAKLADISYTANAKVIQVQLKTEKELLNILA